VAKWIDHSSHPGRSQSIHALYALGCLRNHRLPVLHISTTRVTSALLILGVLALVAAIVVLLSLAGGEHGVGDQSACIAFAAK
jgi:hypothetical protein